MTLTKTSKEWEQLLFAGINLTILDPDGWDRKNYKESFEEEKISPIEFRNRVSMSTCMADLDAFKELDRRVEAFTDEAERVIDRGRMPEQLDFLDALR